uniref:DUF7088 domain-containing protein n=1 Tax=Treponema endosymbiont of Eucomonympha sp. TaxID=1580831 RepID=UPI000AF19A1A
GLCRLVSFAWHFDAAGKGIVDSRDLAFYAAATAFFLASTVFLLEKRKRGGASPACRLRAALSAAAFALAVLTAGRYPLRINATSSKRFTPSPFSVRLLSRLGEQVRLTYYLSPELKNLYPQTRDVGDFLQAYAAADNAALTVKDPHRDNAEAALAEIGVRKQQIGLERRNAAEFTDVYSAVTLECLGRTEVVPFAFSAEGLEYELDRRVLSFIDGRRARVTFVCGNGLSPDEDYSYARSWLETAGCHGNTIARAEGTVNAWLRAKRGVMFEFLQGTRHKTGGF